MKHKTLESRVGLNVPINFSLMNLYQDIIVESVMCVHFKVPFSILVLAAHMRYA